MTVLGSKVSTSLGCRPSRGGRQVFLLSRGVPPLPTAAVPPSTSACSIVRSRSGRALPRKPPSAESLVFDSLRQVAASLAGCAPRPEPTDGIHHYFPRHPHFVGFNKLFTTHDTFIFEVEIYIQRYIQIIVKKAHLYETELYDHCL